MPSLSLDAQEEYEKVIEKELCPASGQLRMGEVVRKVSEATGNDAILVTDVGQNQMMGFAISNINVPVVWLLQVA